MQYFGMLRDYHLLLFGVFLVYKKCVLTTQDNLRVFMKKISNEEVSFGDQEIKDVCCCIAYTQKVAYYFFHGLVTLHFSRPYLQTSFGTILEDCITEWLFHNNSEEWVDIIVQQIKHLEPQKLSSRTACTKCPNLKI